MIVGIQNIFVMQSNTKRISLHSANIQPNAESAKRHISNAMCYICNISFVNMQLFIKYRFFPE